jgi:hypothetical protein
MRKVVVPQDVNGEYGDQRVSLKADKYRVESVQTAVISAEGSTDPVFQMHMLTAVSADRAVPISISPEAMEELRQRALIQIED